MRYSRIGCLKASLLGISGVMLSGCGSARIKPKFKESPADLVSDSAPILNFNQVEGIGEHQTKLRDDLQLSFCRNVSSRLQKADFIAEIGLLCQTGEPTALFANIDRLASVVADKPFAVQILMEHLADGYTRGIYVTNYTVPFQPRWVKSATVPRYMTADALFPYMKIDGEILADTSEQLGGDLQFGRYDLSYATTVVAQDGNSFSNSRQTQMDFYQVEGGNSEIGVAGEFLVASANNDFRSYKTISVTMADQEGRSQIMTLVAIDVRNYGYPELTAQVMSDSATEQARRVREGLLADLIEYTVK